MKVFFSTYKDVLWNLVSKNLKAKYAGSFLGMLWAFINPLLLALIISFIFTNIFKMAVRDFYLFVLSGMLPWTFLSGSLQEASLCIPANAALLKQFALPRMIIPLSVVLANFILFLFALLAVMPLFVVAYPGVLFMLPLLMVALVALFLFTLGLSLSLSALCVNSRDITHVLNTLLTFWLWLTPVFYSVDIIPKEYRTLLDANPFQPFLALFRAALLRGSSWNFLELLLGAALCSFVLLTGNYLFSLNENKFLQRI